MSIKSGFAFHCHHDGLVEYVYDFNKRVEFIKIEKPKEDRKLRLKLFKMIPSDRLPIQLAKALDAYDKAWAAYAKAVDAYDKAWAAARAAGAAYDKTKDACDKELNNHTKYFIRLHKELCPNCPWDGKTIFPKKKEG